jgi:hypothetical protein
MTSQCTPLKIPNAGVSEVGRLTDIRTDEKGRPKKPVTKTLEINLVAVLYCMCNTTTIPCDDLIYKNSSCATCRALPSQK